MSAVGDNVIVLVMSPPPVTAEERKATVAKLTDVGLWLSYSNPHFGLAWARCRPRLQVTRRITTMAVTNEAVMLASPDFVAALKPKELAFVLCHELLHVAGDHMTRAVSIGVCNSDGTVADPVKREAWGLATDMVINSALIGDNVGTMPSGPLQGVVLPAMYSGPRDAESVYVWLMKQVKNQSPADALKALWALAGNSQNPGTALRGCLPGGTDAAEKPAEGEGVSKGGSEGDGISTNPNAPPELPLGDTIRAALSQGIGTGSNVAEMLRPRPPRCSWETVLQTGRSMASLESANRTTRTYSRAGRRSTLLRGGVVPGRRGDKPSMAVIIDVSGSMSRESVAQIIGECMKISSLLGNRLFLAVHTEKLEFADWLKPGDVDMLTRATAFSGGTDAEPAYEACRQIGFFDCIVHFTDTMLGGSWPEVPARRLVVGATGLPTGQAPYCPPPPGTRILNVEV